MSSRNSSKSSSTTDRPMRVIEPTTIRLTSDETRMLMKAAVNPEGIAMHYNGRGVIELGLVKKIPAPKDTKAKLEAALKNARQAALASKTWPVLVKRYSAASKAADAVRYAAKPEELHVLTPAGKALVSSITIRRR